MRCKNYYNIHGGNAHPNFNFSRSRCISILKFSRSVSLSFCLSSFSFSRLTWFSVLDWFRIRRSSSFKVGLTFVGGDGKVWLQEHEEACKRLYGGIEVVWTHWNVRFRDGFGGIEVVWAWKIASFCKDFLEIGWGGRIGSTFKLFVFHLLRRKWVILLVLLNILAGLFCPIIAAKTEVK